MYSILFVLLIAGCQVLTAGVLPSISQTLTPSRLAEAIPESRDRPATAKPLATVTSYDRVLIEPKTVTFVRGKKGQDYPDYKEAIVHYPQVSGLADQAVLRNVQSAVSLKSVFGQSLAELRAEFLTSWWLSEIVYTVNYNQDSLLDLTFTISGSGAYPSSYDKHRLVNLKTGKVVKAADVFKRESLRPIVAMVNNAMQAEVKAAIANSGKEGVDLRDQLKNQRFQLKNLNDFAINNKGVTFFYDFGFPHVIKALEPSGRYFFRYEQLKTVIKPDGALEVLRSKAVGVRG